MKLRPSPSPRSSALAASSVSALLLTLSACGGAEPEPDPVPMEPAPMAQLPEAPLGPLEGCEQGVETTQGVLLRCPGYNLLVGGWVQAMPLALLDQARQGVVQGRPAQEVDVGPAPLRAHGKTLDGFVYALGRSGGQRGHVMVVSDPQGRARLMHCMVEAEAQLEPCRVGAQEVALLGQVPVHLSPDPRRGDATGAATLVPRLHDKPLLVPPGCQAQGAQISCESAMLSWREVSDAEVQTFEQAYIQQLEASVAQRLEITHREDRRCALRNQRVTCRVLMTRDEQHGAGRVVVAPLRHEGRRAVVMCVDQPARRAEPLAKVCAQLMEWR